MTGTILPRVRTGHGGDAVGEGADRHVTSGSSEIDVSVIVAVHNCRPYLDRCLTSLLIQRVSREIVVVDDGSTDGSTELLDLYAAHHRGVIRVIRQEHSGGAGRPCNVGISYARGRYVFFCDADDYLGPEALERMLAMADRNDSDIVLGKIVGHDRRAPVSMFRQSAERAPLGASAVYNSLSCFKLFRREMLELHTIRFDETLLVGEDVVFTAHAYCHADVISVVADYDCYHLVSRPDGSSIMQQEGSRDPVSWLRMIRRPIELVVAHVRPGALRDHLLRRHFRLDAFGALGGPFLAAGSSSARRSSPRWPTCATAGSPTASAPGSPSSTGTGSPRSRTSTAWYGWRTSSRPWCAGSSPSSAGTGRTGWSSPAGSS